ncbi:MAG: hypothetical protein KatS3mg065_0372 [Chloroflexota bacterium]|nr:MAG: hypothetical protein KatS3mg065_0372 [Chloroflexota bacterium]
MIEAVALLLVAGVLFGAAVRAGIILAARLDRVVMRLVGADGGDDAAASGGSGPPDEGSER